MRPHDETVRAAIEQSLGSTLKTLCAPPSGLFVRRRELWESTLAALGRWAPVLAKQLSSENGFAAIATVSSVVSNPEEEPPQEEAKVVAAVMLDDGLGLGGAPSAPSAAAEEKGAEGVVFEQLSNAAEGEEEDEGCVVQ
jgi:hypothetical protein